MRKRRSGNKNPHVGRDYLRPIEANAVIEAAGRAGRQRLRDQVLLRLIYRHGLRASEGIHTRWTDFDLTPGAGPKTFHVRRLKGSPQHVHSGRVPGGSPEAGQDGPPAPGFLVFRAFEWSGWTG